MSEYMQGYVAGVLVSGAIYLLLFYVPRRLGK
jgi:hypothetical protein